MRLRSLEVWHWRGLEHVAIDDLHEGLNLVCGPNESGKSRLFQALQLGLMEPYKGQAQHKRELQGWGCPHAPRVRVAFELGGVEYTLEKQFLKGAYATLAGGGETLTNDAAERRLRELMQVDKPGRTGLGPEGQGLWRLLWVQQGTAGVVPHEDLNEAPRTDLESRLMEEVGQVAAGPLGQRILERAREERLRYYSDAGNEAGELKEARKIHEQALQEHEAAQAARERVHQEAQELARVEQALSALQHRLQQAHERRDRLSARKKAAERVRQELRTCDEMVQRLAGEEREAARALQARREAMRDLEAWQRDAVELEAALARSRERLETSRAQAAAADVEVKEAESAFARAREAQRAARRGQQRRQAREARERLGRQLDEARALDAQRARVQASLAAAVVDEEGVQALRRADSKLVEAEAQLRGASVEVRIEALRDVHVGDRFLRAGEHHEAQLSEPVRWQIGDHARVEVRPGARGLGKLGDAVRDARAVRDELVQRMHVADTLAAQRALDARKQEEERLRSLQDRLAQIAPEGLGALEARLAALASEDEESDVQAPSIEEAHEAEEAAHERVRKARATRDAIMEPLAEMREEASRLQHRHEHAKQEVERLQAALEPMAPEEALHARHDEARRRHAEALRAQQELQCQFEAQGGEHVVDDLEQAERALENQRARQRDLEQGRHRLQAVLERTGGEELHEREQECAQRLGEAEEAIVRVERRANAARYLERVLVEARRSAQQRLTEPVRRRIAPYLAMLFPGSELSLDDRWELRGLQSGDVEEQFSKLSAGAREQLGLLVRVGIGEILAADTRLPLILDDPMVNTDAKRRQAMLRVLGRASRHLQILVLTCHRDAFDALGAHREYDLETTRKAS